MLIATLCNWIVHWTRVARYRAYLGTRSSSVRWNRADYSRCWLYGWKWVSISRKFPSCRGIGASNGTIGYWPSQLRWNYSPDARNLVNGTSREWEKLITKQSQDCRLASGSIVTFTDQLIASGNVWSASSKIAFLRRAFNNIVDGIDSFIRTDSVLIVVTNWCAKWKFLVEVADEATRGDRKDIFYEMCFIRESGRTFVLCVPMCISERFIPMEMKNFRLNIPQGKRSFSLSSKSTFQWRKWKIERIRKCRNFDVIC